MDMSEQSARVTVRGGCHCGAIRFVAEVEAQPKVLDCNCSICVKTGFRHLIVPHDKFRLEQGAEALTSYRFGTGAAEHLFCRICGVKSFYQPRSHPAAWSVNFNALDDAGPLEPDFENFDGRNWEEARTRLG
jgi:hypothetical protein